MQESRTVIVASERLRTTELCINKLDLLPYDSFVCQPATEIVHHSTTLAQLITAVMANSSISSYLVDGEAVLVVCDPPAAGGR